MAGTGDKSEKALGGNRALFSFTLDRYGSWLLPRLHASRRRFAATVKHV